MLEVQEVQEAAAGEVQEAARLVFLNTIRRITCKHTIAT